MASVDLDLRGTPGGTDLDLGGSSGDDRTVVIAATTAAPRSALSALRGPLAAITARTSAPSAAVRILSGRVAAIAATTAAPTAALAGIVRVVLTGTVQARTAAPRSAAAGAFDWNMLTQDVAPSRLAWLRSGGGLQAQATIGYRDGPQAGSDAASPWTDGVPAGGAGADTWRDAARATGDGVPRWSDGRLATETRPDRWRDPERASQSGRDQWRHGAQTDHASPGAWTSPYHVGTQQSLAWRTQPPLETLPVVADLGDGPQVSAALRACWRDAALVMYVVRPPPPPPPPPPWEHWGNDLCLWRPLGAPLDIGVLPTCSEQRTVPIRRVYVVIYNVSLTRLDTGQEVAASRLSVALDADSWAWTWSGTLVGAGALALIQADEPVTLRAEVNGYAWHLLAEDWTEDREFGSRSIKVSGRGLSAWLASPYALPTSGTLPADRTVNQAMEEMLPPGWTMVWDAPDWLLPAGSWSWSRVSPIQAIHAAAQEMGLMVVPYRSAQTLMVKPRYPVLPWAYGQADLTVPLGAILRTSRRRRIEAQGNAVYVHGGEVGGISAQVYLSGSGADRLAPTRSSALVTHVDAARLLGGRILAGQAVQPEIREATIPLGGDFPLAALGQLVDLAGSKGTVAGVNVTAGEGRARQVIRIGEDTNNVWSRFRALVPESPVLLGTVLADHGDGTVTVETLGGGEVRVRGSGSGKVWIRDHRVEGPAPDLPGYSIDV